MVSFVELPEDVLIAIYAYITPRDIFSLNQTCRSLSYLGYIDYVWRKLNYDLPLDIHQDTGTQKRYNRKEIRQSVLNSLQVDADWNNKDTPTDIQVFNVEEDIGDIAQVQLLRDDWLIILFDGPDIRLEAWNLKTDRFVQAFFTFFGRTSFSAAVRDDGKTATIAVCQSIGYIEVLKLTLDEENVPESDGEPIILESVSRMYTRSPHSAHSSPFDIYKDIQVNGNIVAVSMERLNSNIAPKFQWMVSNIETGVCMRVGIDLEQDGEEVKKFCFKLFPGHIVCLSSSNNQGLLYAHDISHLSSADVQMHSQNQLRSTFYVDDQPLVKPRCSKELTSPFFGCGMKIAFTREPITRYQQIISFLSSCRDKSYLFRLHLTDLTSATIGARKSNVEPIADCHVPSYNGNPSIGLGQTGLRMIWLEFDPCYYKAIKFTFPECGTTNSVVMKDLLLHDIEPYLLYPFKALWFQEATGILCMTFHGDLVIMKI